MRPSARTLALLTALIAAAALGFALALEKWGGIVPCALCLLERWPYRVAIVAGLLALVLPPRPGRVLLLLVVLALIVDAALGFTHFGVEARWWPSPLPECAAPRFSGGSIAERLASMPAHPAKPCDEPTYLIPGLPLSLAALNMLFSLGFGSTLAILLWRGARRRA